MNFPARSVKTAGDSTLVLFLVNIFYEVILSCLICGSIFGGKVTETRLAAALDLPQRTFSNYLNAKSQRNLWDLLPRILERFPQISRDWLYFGEGEMLDEAGADLPQHERSLSTRLMRPDSANSKIQTRSAGETRTSRYSAGLERENTLLREMLADKVKIIALQDEKLQHCEPRALTAKL